MEPAHGRAVVAWVFTLFALTALGALPLLVTGIPLSRVFSASPQWLFLLGVELTAFAPTLAALLIMRIGGNIRSGDQRRHARAGLGWYVAALFGSTVVSFLAAAIELALGGPRPSVSLTLSDLNPISLIGGLIVGPLGEELGWRGFAQRGLQTRYGALGASLVVGVIWSVWHEWPIATGEPWDLASIAMFSLRLIALSILFAFLYNATARTLLVPMSAHAGYNLANQLVPRADGDQLRGPIELLLYIALALTVVAVFGPRTLAPKERPGDAAVAPPT